MPTWVQAPDDAVAEVEPGQTVAIGGFLSSRHPMALVRALVRRTIRELTLIAPGGGIDVDLLVGAGCVRRVICGVCSLDLVGPAPAFRKAVESGRLEVVDYGGAAIYRSLEAGWRGLPRVPARMLLASDLRRHHPGLPDPAHPDVLHLPPLRPDVALLHAERADAGGDVRVLAPALDAALAAAARRVIVSVEKVLPRETLVRRGGTTIPRSHIDVLVHAPLGAHPTGCFPDYAPDYASLVRYAELVEAGAARSEIDAAFVRADERGYRAAIDVRSLLELRAMAGAGEFLAWTAPSTS